ncbi:MAG: hypothetical protein HY828_08150 [Actinobacteria bacterium]|nr:hypothetical protein [Actinomycetota bacterium]
MRRKALIAAAIMVLPLVGFGGVSEVSASTSCSVATIWINGNPGAEPGSWAKGHTHATGNHYVGYYYYSSGLGRWVWVYYADNNGGEDGDTADTLYGSTTCNGTP